MKYAIAALIKGEKLPTREFPPREHDIPKNDLSRDLKVGDIVLPRISGSSAWISGVICHFTSSPYYHVEINVKDGYNISANGTGVGWNDIYVKPIFDLFRFKGGLDRTQRLMIYAKAAQSILKPYDYTHLFGFPFVKRKSAVRKAGNDAYICSELTAWIYDEIGLPLIGDIPTSMTAPADIGHSDALEYVGAYKNGWKIVAEPNEFLSEDKEIIGKKASKFLEAISTRDEYYEGLYLNRDKMNS